MHEPSALDSIATVLPLFPEVRWDRYTGDEYHAEAYGWINRSDGPYDFLVLTAQADGVSSFVTSSAEYSEEFMQRLFGTTEGHEPCKRIADLAAEIVGRRPVVDAATLP